MNLIKRGSLAWFGNSRLRGSEGPKEHEVKPFATRFPVNKIVMYIMGYHGALTSKTYSFTKRIWEVKSIKLVNFFDLFLTEVVFETQNNNILRILPTGLKKTIGGMQYQNFILDKFRFMVDGFKKQEALNKLADRAPWSRYCRPGAAVVIQRFSVALHEFLMRLILMRNLNSLLGGSSGFITPASEVSITNAKPGAYWQHLDVFSIALNEGVVYSKLLGCKAMTYLMGRVKGALLDGRQCFTWLSEFIVNLEDLSGKDHLILIALEIRFDVPLLSMLVRKKHQQLRVFNFGFESFMNTRVYNLGGSALSVAELLLNKHYISIFAFSRKRTKVLINRVLQSWFKKCLYDLESRFDISFLSLNSVYVTCAYLNLAVGSTPFLKLSRAWCRLTAIQYTFNRNYSQGTNLTIRPERADGRGPMMSHTFKIVLGNDMREHEHDSANCEFRIYQPCIFYSTANATLIDVEGHFKRVFEGLWTPGQDNFVKTAKAFFRATAAPTSLSTGRTGRSFFGYAVDIDARTGLQLCAPVYQEVAHLLFVSPNLFINDIYCNNSVANSSHQLSVARTVLLQTNPNYQYVYKN